jgi:drug/metabolite transporter superfamily protein YnfA
MGSNTVVNTIASALASVALGLTLLAWWRSGQPNWQALSGSIGVVVLLLALTVVGRERRGAYYLLLGVSIALALVSIAIGLSR